jgi:hypothetical protein
MKLPTCNSKSVKMSCSVRLLRFDKVNLPNKMENENKRNVRLVFVGLNRNSDHQTGFRIGRDPWFCPKAGKTFPLVERQTF